MSPEEKYRYYGLLAEELAVDHKELEQDGVNPKTVLQENFSVYWYYRENRYDDLPLLSKAALGDNQALQALWGVVPGNGGGPGNGNGNGNGNAQACEEIESGLLEGSDLNTSQKNAVLMALNYPVSLIQGPPGTGKTHTILNMVSVMIKNGYRVAVVSCNNKAITDIVEKIENMETTPATPNRTRLKEGYALLGGAAARSRFVSTHFQFKASKKLKPHYYTGETYGGVKFKREDTIHAEAFTDEYPCVLSTVHSLQNCFCDGSSFQYDYVIMDEASQASIYVGLLALHVARHIVLVGDDEQLPPVLSDEYLRKFATKHPEFNSKTLDDYYQDPDNSFLTLLTKRFKGAANFRFLDKHYRCHPGIIGFCQDYVYGSKLQICTPAYDRTHKMPISITWYEGSFTKSYLISGTDENREQRRTSRVNWRQIRIFMNEKYLDLLRKIEQEDKSVAILSPYRGQLYALRDTILDYNRQNNVELQIELNGISPQEQDDAEEDPDALSLLTIHKSQGTEFDIIYIFTVDDDAESRSFDFPWTQKRRLINVATSRAKEELHIITSTNLMSEGIQQRLVGYAINKGHQNSAKDYFVEKLIDYAYAYFNTFPDLQEDAFGFFRARTLSVFDKKTYQMKIDGVDLKSSNEDCMQEALNGSAVISSMRFKVGYEYPIRQFIDDNPNAKKAYNSLTDPALKAFLRTDTHMDFPVTTENGILLLDVEVDGEQHEEEDQARKDRMKDSFLQDTLGIPVMRFKDLGNRYMDDDAVTGADIVSDDLNQIDHIERELIRRFQQTRTGEKYYLH